MYKKGPACSACPRGSTCSRTNAGLCSASSRFGTSNEGGCPDDAADCPITCPEGAEICPDGSCPNEAGECSVETGTCLNDDCQGATSDESPFGSETNPKFAPMILVNPVNPGAKIP